MLRSILFLALAFGFTVQIVAATGNEGNEGGYRNPDYYPHTWYLYDFHGGSHADAPFKGRDAEQSSEYTFGTYSLAQAKKEEPCDCCKG